MDLFVPTAVGAIIGYFTNWLAIKMLFWPREPKFVFGHRLPFTPGIFVDRRRDFINSLSALAEDRFVTGDQIYDLFRRAITSGAVDEVLDKMGKMFRFAFNVYMARSPPDVIRADCRLIAEQLRTSRLVSATLVAAMDVMSDEEIEKMILAVVDRELVAITWLGGVLGAAIGALQGVW